MNNGTHFLAVFAFIARETACDKLAADVRGCTRNAHIIYNVGVTCPWQTIIIVDTTFLLNSVPQQHRLK